MEHIIDDFESSCIELINLKNKIQGIQTQLKKYLKISREFGIPLINNPLLKIQNQLIELEYLSSQHSLNCAVYQDLINDGCEINQDLYQQLQGLLQDQKELSNRFIFENAKLEAFNITQKTPQKQLNFIE